jgi:hypothetical protein
MQHDGPKVDAFGPLRYCGMVSGSAIQPRTASPSQGIKKHVGDLGRGGEDLHDLDSVWALSKAVNRG